MNTASTSPVNHHADFPGFAGLTGLLAGLIMIVGGVAWPDSPLIWPRCRVATTLSTSAAAPAPPPGRLPAVEHASPGSIRPP